MEETLRWAEARVTRLHQALAQAKRELAALRKAAEAGAAPAADLPPVVAEDVVLAEVAKTILRLRDYRGRFFRKEALGEPMWDMSLDLFVAWVEKRDVCVSSLCIAARVPATTALRHIHDMTCAGEVVKRRDPADARRIYVQLTERGLTAIRAALRCQPGWPFGREDALSSC